ncbi:MAG: hypothetical protein JWO92_2548 [Chitinophagaceae bacterium]|nr:hypothetical protein [Chitinophagaceae bacterium]
MENVLINFQGDTSGLKPAEDALDSLLTKDEALKDAWKKTSAEMSNATKGSTAETNRLAKSIDQLAAATKSMDKSVVGGAYTQYLKEIQKQLGLTQKELITYVQTARKAAQAEILNPETTHDVKELQLSVEVMNDTLKKMGVNMEATGERTSQLRTRLMGAKEEFAKLIENGIQSGPAFDNAKKKLSELSDQMRDVNEVTKNLGSDTKGLDGLISLATGVAGGMAVAQGAAALLGDEDKDLQTALLRVNAAMSILQGLTAIQNVLQKESAASLLLNNLLRKESVVQTVAQTVATEGLAVAEGEQALATEAATVATGEQVVATEAATVAQTGLNLAFLANPVFLLIAGVAELIGLYKILFTDLGHGLEKQKELNYEFDLSTKQVNENVAAIAKAKDIIVANLKSQGASTKAIRDAETFNIKDQLSEVEKVEAGKREQYSKTMAILKAVSDGRLKIDADEITEYEKYRDQYNAITKTIIDLKNQLAVKQVDDNIQANADNFKNFEASQQARVALTIAGSDRERNVQIQTIRAIGSEREKTLAFQSLTDGEKALARMSDEKQIQGLQLANYQHYLKGKTDAVDAQIAIVKAHQATSDADAIANFNKISNLQIAAIKRQQKEALANPTLNKGEREKIIDDANLAIIEAEKKKQADILNIQKQSLTLQSSASIKGSNEEYLYKILLIENERRAAILAAGKNVDLLKAIDAKYFKERADALRSFNEILLQDAISRDNAELSQFGLTEQKKLTLTLERLNDQQQLELSQANGNASKIKEINAKFNKERLEANKATTEAILQQNIKQVDIFGEILSKKNQAILSDPLSSETAKLIAANEILNQEQLKTDLEYDALEKEKKTLTAEEYARRLQAIRNQEDADIKAHAKTELDIFKETQQKKLDFLKASISVLQNGIDVLGASGIKTGLTEALGLFTKINSAVAAYQAALKDPNADKVAAKQAETAAIITASIVATQATLNQVFADSAAGRQQLLQDDLQALENQKQKEIDNANLTEQQKSDIQKKYADKERQAKQKAYEDDKRAKISQAIINGALAITNIFATVPKFDFGASTFILAGIAAATTALEVGLIKSQPTPKFKKGQIDIQGPGTTTSDSIPAFISRGESVIKADSTAKWKEALEAINNDKFEHYIQNKFIYPQIPDFIQTNTSMGQSIDYKLLAKEVAKEMKGVIPSPQSTHVNINEKGIQTIVKDGSSTTEYRNKRYSIKP